MENAEDQVDACISPSGGTRYMLDLTWVQVPKNQMGGCQNYGPFLGTQNIRCRTIIGTPKGSIILTATHILARNL